ncbi:MAG: VIT domain-containing protein [Planctomycetota bacterium]|jgi:hypothetical protein
MRALVSFVAALLLALVAVPPPAWAHAGGSFIREGQVPLPPELREPTDPLPPPPPPRVKMAFGLHAVDARIHGRLADVQLEQVIGNPHAAAEEAGFVLCLPANAVVYDWQLVTGGETIVGDVRTGRDARTTYEKIVRIQRDPALLESLGRGLYRVRVFPVPATGEVMIRLRYRQLLYERRGRLVFRYPLAEGRRNGVPAEALKIDVHVASEIDLGTVTCPSHDAAIAQRGRLAHVSYRRLEDDNGTDFVVHVPKSRAEDRFPILQAASFPGRGDAPTHVFAELRLVRLLGDLGQGHATDEARAEVEALALRHGLVTPYTAALAAPESELRLLERPPGGQWRGPGGDVPPGMHEPQDPPPPPPPPPETDPTAP